MDVAGCGEYLPCFPCGKSSDVRAHLLARAGGREVCPARRGCTICHLTECNSGLSLHKETMRSAGMQRMRLLFVQGGHGAFRKHAAEPGLSISSLTTDRTLRVAR